MEVSVYDKYLGLIQIQLLFNLPKYEFDLFILTKYEWVKGMVSTQGIKRFVACGPKATAQTDIILIFIYIQGKLGSFPPHPHPPKHFRAFLDF